ncbi:glycosyltransferase, partial [Candidatus Berkelbacteria bacterium]|nr:glycosyltransferase [Candidatus Berkelbacteria bacterium]
KFVKEKYPKHKVVGSMLQKFPLVYRLFDLYRPLMPIAIEQLDLRGYELVISLSHSFEKGVLTTPDQLHVCYCFTPPRYLWLDPATHLTRAGVGMLAKLAPPVQTYLRLWDRAASLRVDQFVVISEAVRARVAKFYRRDSQLIYPPVETRRFRSVGKHRSTGDYFLLVGRLEPHKEVGLAIEAFNQLSERLLIVGEGKGEKGLKRLAQSNIEFFGRVSEAELAKLYQGAKAVLFPQEEDFGIVAVEAQAAGRPVIALRRGGAMETVIEGKTGVFFDEQRPEVLVEAVKKCQAINWNQRAIAAHAAKFDVAVFSRQWKQLIAKVSK